MNEQRQRIGSTGSTDANYDVADDGFIPVRYGELAGHLADMLQQAGDRRERFLAVAGAIFEIILQEATAFETHLADHYAPFNPDRDTLTQRRLDAPARERAYPELFQALTYLLRKANFDLVTEGEFKTAVAEARSQGLRLDLDDDRVENLYMCCRGRGSVKRKVRNWQTRFREQQLELPIYNRFAVIIKLRDEPWIFLKLFKNIPRMEIEALLPHARVRMTLMDQLKLAGGGAGAIGGSVYKLFQLLWGVAKVAAFWSQFLWILTVGALVLGVKTVTGYRNIRRHRDADRTRNLYFQNLDNNAGAIHALVAMVSEEEAKEALLAYALCLTEPETRPRDAADLDARVEAFLRERYDASADYQVDDAVETLQRLRLWQEVEAMAVFSPDDALPRLTEHWCSRATLRYHLDHACRERRPGPPGAGGQPSESTAGQSPSDDTSPAA